MSTFVLCRVNFPLCIREKSSSSSTICESRSVSVDMTLIPLVTVSLSSGIVPIVSAQPLIAVRGVRSS